MLRKNIGGCIPSIPADNATTRVDLTFRNSKEHLRNKEHLKSNVKNHRKTEVLCNFENLTQFRKFSRKIRKYPKYTMPRLPTYNRRQLLRSDTVILMTLHFSKLSYHNYNSRREVFCFKITKLLKQNCTFSKIAFFDMKSSAHNNEFDIIWQVTFRFKLSLNAWLWKSDQGSPSTTPPKTDLNGFWLPGYNNGAIYNLTNYAISTWQAHAADPQGSHTPSLIDSIRCPGDIEMRSWRARCHSWLAVSYSCNADVCTRMSTSSVCQIAPAVRTHYKWPIFEDLVVGDPWLDFHIQVFDESLKHRQSDDVKIIVVCWRLPIKKCDFRKDSILPSKALLIDSDHRQKL